MALRRGKPYRVPCLRALAEAVDTAFLARSCCVVRVSVQRAGRPLDVVVGLVDVIRAACPYLGHGLGVAALLVCPCPPQVFPSA